jgi:hypothetical protein
LLKNGERSTTTYSVNTAPNYGAQKITTTGTNQYYCPSHTYNCGVETTNGNATAMLCCPF